MAIEEHNPTSNSDRILSSKQACEILSIPRSTFFARQSERNKLFDPNFPKPLRMGGRNGYLESEVQAYIRHLASNR